MSKRAYRIVLMRADDNRGANAPQLPASWDVAAESHHWFTVWPLGRAVAPDVFVHARCMVRGEGAQAERACYVWIGNEAQMQALDARVQALISAGATWVRSWADLAALRSDGTAAATAVKSAWRDERPEDDAGSLVRLFARMAGFNDDDAEGQAA